MLWPWSPIHVFTYQRVWKSIFKLRLKTSQTLVRHMGPLRHLSSRRSYFSPLKSRDRKQTCLCLGRRGIFCSQQHKFYSLQSGTKPRSCPFVSLSLLIQQGRHKSPAFLSEQTVITCFSCFSHRTIFRCRNLWRWCPGSPPPRLGRWSDPGWWEPTGRLRLPEPGRCHGTFCTEPGPPRTAAGGPCGEPGSGWGPQTGGRHT